MPSIPGLKSDSPLSNTSSDYILTGIQKANNLSNGFAVLIGCLPSNVICPQGLGQAFRIRPVTQYYKYSPVAVIN